MGEHEKELDQRREKMRMLDFKFEEVVNKMYDNMQRINSRAEDIMESDHGHDLRNHGEAAVLRNRAKRENDVRRMSECVEELTDMNSARNQLRMSLRNLDDEMLGLSGRVGDMGLLHGQERTFADNETELDMLQALAAKSR